MKRPAGHRWRIIRQQVLDSSRSCALQLDEGCTRYATTVDHIVPLSRGGHPTARENLQPACSHCNNLKGARDDLRPANTTSREW